MNFPFTYNINNSRISKTDNMNAKDLRIGNIVHYKVNDELDERKEWNEINIVDAEDILSIEDYESKKQEHPYYPIPLTEEWLKNLGFIQTYKSSMQTRYDADELGHGEIGITIWEGKWSFRYYSERNISCKYVHQLQNLHFALTGEELSYQHMKHPS